MPSPPARPLAQRALYGAKWTTAASLVAIAVQVGQLAFLARLLGPTAFGVAAVAQFLVQLGVLFVDFGVANALFVRTQVAQRLLDTLFWLSVLGGLVIGGGVALASPWVAGFYRMPDLPPLLWASALALVLLGPGTHYRTLLARAQKFKTLAAVEAGSAVVSAVVNVVLALLGYGVLSFAYSIAAKAAFQAGAYVYYGWPLYRPGRSWDGAEARVLLRFGALQMGTSLLSATGAAADTLLTSRLLSATALGYIDSAKSLIARPLALYTPIVQRVGLPLLSELRDDPEALRRAYLASVRVSLLLFLPVYVTLALVAPWLVAVLLGPGWATAGVLLQLLSVTGLLRATLLPLGSVLLALGRVGLMFRWTLGYALTALLCVWAGSYWGVVGIAGGISLQLVGIWTLQVTVQAPAAVGLSAGVYFTAWRAFLPVMAALAAAGLGLHLLWAAVPVPAWLALVAGGVVLGLVYAGVVWYTVPDARRYWQLVRGQDPSRSSR